MNHITGTGNDLVDENRAAVLMGLTLDELKCLSRWAALGSKVVSDCEERLFFTYEELLRLSTLAARLCG